MGWYTQSNSDDAKVNAKPGLDANGNERTEFMIVDKSSGLHNHTSESAEPGGGTTEYHGYDRR
jgi:hypothetical protein